MLTLLLALKVFLNMLLGSTTLSPFTFILLLGGRYRCVGCGNNALPDNISLSVEESELCAALFDFIACALGIALAVSMQLWIKTSSDMTLCNLVHILKYKTNHSKYNQRRILFNLILKKSIVFSSVMYIM